MKKLVVTLFFFAGFSFCVNAQQIPVAKTLARIFVEIPDSFFLAFKKCQPDSVQLDRKFRLQLTDSISVSEEWNPVLHFTAFDSLHAYLKFMAKMGDPEGMWGELAFWKQSNGKRLVLMSVNYGDMCVEEQLFLYAWIDDGKKLQPVNALDFFPRLTAGQCIAPAFLRQKKIPASTIPPYMILLEGKGKSITFSLAFDYLSSCSDSFEDDLWFGLTDASILHSETVLSWNGEKFVLPKKPR